MKTILATCLVAAAFCASAQDAALPKYQAQGRLSGVIRVSGNDRMQPLLKRWERGFRKYQPDVRFEETLRGTASAMYGLEMRTADIALMGRPVNPYERYGTYERSWVYPVEIEVATGSFAVPGKSPAYAIFVNRENPLGKLTLKQLDGIFGAERAGGWNALTWDEGSARGKDANVRTWGQVGLGGEWAGQAIHVYGPPNLGTGTTTYFQTRVMGGGEIFNEDLLEYADRKQMVADLARDRYGIAYGPLGVRIPGVKPIAVAEHEGGPYVELTRASVTDRTYPLARPVYMVFNIDNTKSEISATRGDPRVREFLRYVLSEEGQRAVAHDGVYLPLPASIASAQFAKIDFDGVPPERKLLREDD
ncbi:MAG TPA: substrate-binding domain-containing protein [Usitatibacter sp.]|jgi:phosphate transport system substrate-binding protein|nr:substrate-binding domain-containing protein [Usitatibacter sp.]